LGSPFQRAADPLRPAPWNKASDINLHREHPQSDAEFRDSQLSLSLGGA
jgi:hypothetical protein